MRSGLFVSPCCPVEPAASLLRRLLFYILLSVLPAWAESHKQNFSDFTTPLPLKPGDTLVIGILGGWEPWDRPYRLVRRICLHLREAGLPNTYIETIENHRLELGRELILKAFDRDDDGKLSDAERGAARIIVYGQSMGAASSIELCRWLKKQGMPVMLNVQIDSVGLRDGKVPSNVQSAANLYQRDIGPIRGRAKIKAENRKQTVILGNWRYRYPFWKYVNTEEETPLRRTLMIPHLKMEFDPEVWQRVESLIRLSIFSSAPFGRR